MSETIQIENCTAVVRELRKVRWPDGKWIVFCGALEATGSTRDNAIYNFKRLIGART